MLFIVCVGPFSDTDLYWSWQVIRRCHQKSMLNLVIIIFHYFILIVIIIQYQLDIAYYLLQPYLTHACNLCSCLLLGEYCRFTERCNRCWEQSNLLTAPESFLQHTLYVKLNKVPLHQYSDAVQQQQASGYILHERYKCRNELNNKKHNVLFWFFVLFCRQALSGYTSLRQKTYVYSDFF